MTDAPIIFTWQEVFDENGEIVNAMVPLDRFHNLAGERYTVGGKYRMEIVEDRSQRSHSHYFAMVHEYWLNLPEVLTARFPTAEHLRKYALIMSGFSDETTYVCENGAKAQQLARIVRQLDDFAVAVIDGNLVAIRTAKSQSYRAMGRKQFQDSKDKVLGVLEEIVGTVVETQHA